MLSADVPAAESTSSAVQFRHVTLNLNRNDGTRFRLGPLDFEIASGTVTLLRGPNGSGKSTIMRLIAGLNRPDTGDIHVDGHRISQLSDKDLTQMRRTRVGLVHQKPLLMDFLSVRENILVGLAIRKPSRTEPIDSVLEDLGLLQLSHARPAHLSDGQRVLAALAQAFLCHPPILLLDEPTANLDERFSAVAWEYIHRACEQGSTAIIASHDPVAHEHADLTLHLRDGHFVDAS
jgi:putative ABC transport system ATP-binding protein